MATNLSLTAQSISADPFSPSTPNRPNRLKTSNKNVVSSKNIKVTAHARERARERLHIGRENDIKKMAHAARYHGIRVGGGLTAETYEYFGLSYWKYKFLKSHYGEKCNNQRFYLYQDYVWVFNGHGSCTLQSIVPCSDDDVAEWANRTCGGEWSRWKEQMAEGYKNTYAVQKSAVVASVGPTGGFPVEQEKYVPERVGEGSEGQQMVLAAFN